MSGDSVERGGRVLLLVEDNAGDARLLREILSEASSFPHTLLHVERLARALTLLADTRVDVVLLDLTLPDAVGLDGLRAIHSAHPLMPIVVLTGLSDEALALEAVKTGAQDYLFKGDADARLIARSIRYAIERSRSEEAAREHLLAQTAHAAAVEEQGRLRTLFMQAPAAICVLTGPKFVFELANARYLQLVGKTDLVGKALLDAIPELAGQGFERILESVRSSGEAFFGNEVPCRLDRRGSGSLVDVLVDFVYEPMRNADGVIESIMVVATDVTEQALARRRVEDARREAALSEQKFQLLAEAIPQIVWSVSADGGDAYLSPRWDEYTGQAESEALVDKWRNALHPDDYERWLATWAEAGARRALWQVECRLRRRDGVYRWHLGRSIPHCAPGGPILRWYGTATDIDEQRSAIRSRDDLLATVSHDLRSPLGVITMAADILQRSHRGDRALGAIERAAKQMERLIQDLLDMASIESGHLSVAPTTGSVTELIAEAIERIQPLASAKLIALEADVAAEPLPAHFDRERVLQVFSNVLGNAVKFTPARGRISIQARGLDARFIQVAISDTGNGIDPAQLPFVFDRFWQAKETARAGTGLGLAICKGIIERHGGSIWVESELSVGTTFYFTLPSGAAAPE
jgi:PAS domain S-box-containing protein